MNDILLNTRSKQYIFSFMKISRLVKISIVWNAVNKWFSFLQLNTPTLKDVQSVRKRNLLHLQAN